MKTITEKFTIGVDKQAGTDVSAKNGNLLAVTESGKNVWFPKGAKLGSEITYKEHEKGDTFVANRDSSRTKGAVMGADCPAGHEDEPLYLKGETVTRTSATIEFVGFAGEKVLSFEDKIAIMAKYGVAVKM